MSAVLAHWANCKTRLLLSIHPKSTGRLTSSTRSSSSFVSASESRKLSPGCASASASSSSLRTLERERGARETKCEKSSAEGMGKFSCRASPSLPARRLGMHQAKHPRVHFRLIPIPRARQFACGLDLRPAREERSPVSLRWHAPRILA